MKLLLVCEWCETSIDFGYLKFWLHRSSGYHKLIDQRWVVPLFFVFSHSTVEYLLKKTFDCWVHNFSKKNFQSNGWVPALKCTRMGVIECLLACACLVHAKFWTKVYQLQAPDLDIFFSKTGFIISQHWSRLKNDIFAD